MRLLTPRRVAVTALCAALTLGTAGPALAHSTPRAAAQQARTPADIGDILGSIGGVLDSVLGTVTGTGSTQAMPSSEMNQQMKDLTTAIEALRKAVAESKTNTNTSTANTVNPSNPASPDSGTNTGSTAPRTPVDDVTPDAAGDLDALDGADSPDGADADVDKAMDAMDKAIDNLVAAAMKGQAVTSASQVQTATQALMDAIMRDVAKSAPTTGTNTLPATTLPAATLPAATLPAAAR
ncbi:hypothetical protein ACF068_19060 [Streptomyces sp. NPDC016309]|uniref:hypothetical protein n=1 Tax=Streptomyces sp. NPDC016309 TaxID=3364965 RepID=UPI0036FE088B